MTSILQKRVRELVQGSRPMVETNKTRPIDIALEELLNDKLSLEHSTDDDVQAPEDIFTSDV